MMKIKTCCIALVLLLLLSSGLVVSAAEKTYQNTETNYKALIMDDNDLLTEEEEAKLLQDMQPLTEYGNIAFWTTTENTSNEIDQARLKRKELFGFDSAGIFVINMKVRKLTVQSYGTVNGYVNDSYARSITNNASHFATSKDYYECAKTVFEQMLNLCQKLDIAEPLKISGYVVVSIMLGLIIALGVAFSKRQNPLLQYEVEDFGKRYRAEGSFEEGVTASFTGCTTSHRPPAPMVTFSSGSSCSGGSSCSSCSSGSSCSSCGGGGCGSGGSSSF